MPRITETKYQYQCPTCEKTTEPSTQSNLPVGWIRLQSKKDTIGVSPSGVEFFVGRRRPSLGQHIHISDKEWCSEECMFEYFRTIINRASYRV